MRAMLAAGALAGIATIIPATNAYAATSYDLYARVRLESIQGEYSYEKSGTCGAGGYPTYSANFDGRISTPYENAKLIVDYDECVSGHWEQKRDIEDDRATYVYWSESRVANVRFYFCSFHDEQIVECARLRRV